MHHSMQRDIGGQHIKVVGNRLITKDPRAARRRRHSEYPRMPSDVHDGVAIAEASQASAVESMDKNLIENRQVARASANDKSQAVPEVNAVPPTPWKETQIVQDPNPRLPVLAEHRHRVRRFTD